MSKKNKQKATPDHALTPELQELLEENYRGKWVAFHAGELLASGDSLKDLLFAMGDQKATVMLVPVDEVSYETNF